jgi:putative heme iron utilization protein
MPADDATADPQATDSQGPQGIQATGDDGADIVAAEQGARAEDPAANARQWLIDNHVATLCTSSTRSGLDGYPFGSVVPYALTGEGKPVIYIATIAAHTANLRADNRASLFVRQPDTDGDPQNGWRLTVMGRMKRLAELHDEVSGKDEHVVERVCQAELDGIHARYLETTPWAKQYGLTHGFAYWRMSEIEAVRYIAGFGKICWLQGEEVVADAMAGGLDKASEGAVAHMNEDHRENMIEMVEGLYGFTPSSATMTRLDRLGFFLKTEAPDRLLHFSFGKAIDAGTLRPAVIDVLKKAREAKAAASS